jgi:hypothetical protein
VIALATPGHEGADVGGRGVGRSLSGQGKLGLDEDGVKIDVGLDFFTMATIGGQLGEGF